MSSESEQETERKEETRPSDKERGVGERSPFAGCAILTVALLVMVFLIVFSVVVLFRQFGEIEKFTAEEPERLQVVGLEDREEYLNALAEKVEGFRLAVENDESAVLELDAEELNLAIAAYEAFEDLRGMLLVREITEERMVIDISFRLNGKPRLAREGEQGIIGSDPMYLNGAMMAEPGLLDREVVLRVRDIEVDGAEVPREFVEQMSPYRIAERYAGSGGIGAVMGELTEVDLGDGVLRFANEAGEEAEDTVTDAEVDDASRRLFKVLGIAASLFLLFVAVILFTGLRLKKRRECSV